MGVKAYIANDIESLVSQVCSQAQAGDHILCMSNGGFGGVHEKLLHSLQIK
jgi:UDP-N-acetylmuramate: L-alanyl-gamma-D-glutamyl-meso-diaminopimelate ligase